MFHSIRAKQVALGLDPWAPFANEEEWVLVKWLIARVGQTAIDEFLKLPITGHMKTSFTSKYTLMKAIDQLPRGTEWKLKRITVKGNVVSNGGQRESEELELWLWDPIDCICELMGNPVPTQDSSPSPAFENMVAYAPERDFADDEGRSRQFDEMWTGDWWWEMQGRLQEGAVVAPVILASDKTALSQFCGDQEVWPVYLTLGNISKDIRRQPSKHAAILIAYLPISKLECFFTRLHVGEIKAIFTLPSCFGKLLHPLIYVHWFRLLQTFDNDLQTFRLVRSSCQHGLNAVVLPADVLLRPCHLIPCFTHKGVVNEVEHFYLNQYIDLELFERLS
ncbi:hypothetical protein EDD22DRAFT_978596 [Suillus occidentalis]|nr:hypothetical protein EDD22DRAFT_978596 [Suillus occidentalis]